MRITPVKLAALWLRNEIHTASVSADGTAESVRVGVRNDQLAASGGISSAIVSQAS